MKKGLFLSLLPFFLIQGILAQTNLDIYGNGLFTSPSSTNVDIKNIDSSTNALIRFGDDNKIKSSLGYNGNEGLFKISMSSTLGREDLTLSTGGYLGLNSIPTNHRMSILHNSNSGVDGSAHLLLMEKGSSDFNRLRFENEDEDGLWTIAARATNGNSLMNFHYNDGVNFANIMSMDGDLFRVGIHQTEPKAYLHIKQQAAGVDVLKFENDASTGGEIWGWRIGDNDILLYFEGALRGSFNSDDGVYTNFPPPTPPAAQIRYTPLAKGTLDKVMQLRPRTKLYVDTDRSYLNLDPNHVESIDPSWIVKSEDGERMNVNYQQFSVVAIKSIQELHEIISAQEGAIQKMQKKMNQLDNQLKALKSNP